jgi:hypothetical protein
MACADVMKRGSMHDFQHVMKLAAFCDPHLPMVVCQMAPNPAEMKNFHSNNLCKRFKIIASDTSKASVGEYAQDTSRLSDHPRMLTPR